MKQVIVFFLVLLISFSSFSATKGSLTPIQTASVSMYVGDFYTGKPYYKKNASTIMPIASITKLMTAMVVLDAKQSLNQYLTYTRYDFQNYMYKYKVTRIKIGSKLTRRDSIRFALMSSSNYAASTLASNYPGGYNKFIQAMNRKARSLKMYNTHFVDANGLHPNNVSTTEDLVKLVRAAYNYKIIRQDTTTATDTIYFKHPRYKLAMVNTNQMVRSSKWDVLLSKTGSLRIAGHSLAMVLNIDGKRVIMVILDNHRKSSNYADASRIKEWLATGKKSTIPLSVKRYQNKKFSMLSDSTYTFPYSVKRGDSVHSIANHYNITPNAIIKENKLNPRKGLRVGQKLLVTVDRNQPDRNPIFFNHSYYTVKKGDSLTLIAKKLNITVSQLLKANNLSISSNIHPGQKLLIKKPKMQKITQKTKPKSQTYKVKSGDNLFDISKQVGVSINNLIKYNNLNNNGDIYPGETLKLDNTTKTKVVNSKEAQNTQKVYTVQSGDSLYQIASQLKTDVEKIISENNFRNGHIIHPGDKIIIPKIEEQHKEIIKPKVKKSFVITYKVKRGDTLSSIASRFKVSIKEIKVWNNLNINKTIHPGQQIQLKVNYN
ncbi:hypothetical protein CF386_12175 [Paraphotobacterium marinum]|uniref:LysM domain-containing protein n=1 Tax=Paraphotobacterium marinum TaxID=1755811 RepID=A0A220VHX6_9GAMM|nr:LysM peptidoglycan-binding domain-containing protein [Paraphotobacterium marinum]ASK79792.1 hypothetical protein CF386_12175 [Paraphotobacterium marinum]